MTDEAREIVWRVRGHKQGEWHPHPEPEVRLPAMYEPHERALMHEIGQARLASTDEEERALLLNEIDTLHEFKALMGARVLTDDEVRAQGLDPATLEPLGPQDGQPAKKAARAPVEGQGALFDAPAPEGPSTSTRRLTKAETAERDNASAAPAPAEPQAPPSDENVSPF